ncbi:prepilin peptidase [Demequina iriomotensis]|uniref:prepilin peptidase n=1 Tax=Demequina iriomotensis TaxID=1536641 RepID=UPI000AF7AFE2|nr:A24 family peptidase [Demequina iriomotensis]
MGPELILALLAGLFGLLIGSFLNVVIWRVPRGESLVSPGSACPSCGAPVRPRDNIPLVSWLVLRGRCRDCAAPISSRYPLVELATGLAFAGVVLVFQDDPWAWPAWWYLAAIGIALALIDLDVQRLPDPIVLPSYIVGIVLLGVATVFGPSDWHDALRGGIGMVVLFVLYAALAIAKPGGMGWGDVKLAGVLGGYLGWLGVGPLVVGSFAAFLLGGLWGIGVMLLGGKSRKSRIPFGPWMLAGAVVGVVAGEALWNAYMGVIS